MKPSSYHHCHYCTGSTANITITKQHQYWTNLGMVYQNQCRKGLAASGVGFQNLGVYIIVGVTETSMKGKKTSETLKNGKYKLFAFMSHGLWTSSLVRERGVGSVYRAWTERRAKWPEFRPGQEETVPRTLIFFPLFTLQGRQFTQTDTIS